jgi:hypothetical protein
VVFEDGRGHFDRFESGTAGDRKPWGEEPQPGRGVGLSAELCRGLVVDPSPGCFQIGGAQYREDQSAVAVGTRAVGAKILYARQTTGHKTGRTAGSSPSVAGPARQRAPFLRSQIQIRLDRRPLRFDCQERFIVRSRSRFRSALRSLIGDALSCPKGVARINTSHQVFPPSSNAGPVRLNNPSR